MKWPSLTSGGAIAALTAVLVFLTYQDLEKKNINLATPSFPTGECSLWTRQAYNRIEIGLCWSVTVTNNSEDPIVLQDFQLGFALDPEDITPGGLQVIEYSDGKPVEFPQTLKSGDFLKVIVRAPFTITSGPELDHTFTYLAEHHNDGPHTLADLRAELVAYGVDLVGNPAWMWHEDGLFLGSDYRLSPPKIFDRVTASFITASGKHENVTLSYPVVEPGVSQVRFR